jgi:hypothetical protein
MARRFRCPLCGSLAWPSGLERSWDIETYRPISLGKAHGFRYDRVDDPFLVAKVKTKILSLYHRLFPSIEASLFPSFGASLGSHMGVTIKPMVTAKMMEVSAYV